MNDRFKQDEADDGAAMALDISDAQAGLRLDKALAELFAEFSRARLKTLIQDGAVSLNGQPAKDPARKVAAGDTIEIDVPPLEPAEPEAENIPLDIVHEDEALLVINKPAGLVVHPGAGNWSGTLVNALLHHCGDTLSGIGGVARPGIVHRLDKDTSGLMVVAKTDKAHRHLSAQLADRSLGRVYHALVWKCPMPAKGTVDKPIGRDPKNRLKMAINLKNGREARTYFKTLERYKEAAALMECELESGRTHQVRVHMAAIKHPLIGDPLYGLQKNAGQSLLNKAGYNQDSIENILSFPRQALHAHAIHFVHPLSEQGMNFESAWPADFKILKNELNQ